MQRFQKHLVAVCSLVLLLAPLFGLLQPTPALAQSFNQQINYQGKLADNLGATVADGSYSMQFRLYTVASGGSNIWSETQSVTVENGLFSVMLGTSTSLSGVDFNQTLYLGVNIEADGEMTPRKILGAVPAAFEAGNSETLGGVASTSFLRNDIPNAASALLSFTGGFISSASSTISELTTGTTTVTTLMIDGEEFTSLSGGASGLTNNAGTLTANISESNLNITGTPTDDYILQASSTAAGGFVWNDSAALGFGDGTFLGLSDTPGSFTNTRIPYMTGSALTTDADFNFDGTNLSIGTTLSLAPLAVSAKSGTTSALFWGNTNENKIAFANAALSDFATVGIMNGGLALSGSPFITNPDIFINNSGNVGIGTSTADTRLTVVHTDGVAADFMRSDTDGQSVIQISNTAQSWKVGMRVTENFFIRDDNTASIPFEIAEGAPTESFFMAASGNLGLGTSTAGSKLTVIGDAYITGALRDSSNSAGTNGYILQTTGAGTEWVATSTLGINSNPFGATINADELASEDFGSFTCNGTTCTLDTSAVATAQILDGTINFGDINYTNTLAGNPALGTGQQFFGSTGIIFEGSTADTFEGLLTTANITGSDKTWTLPNTTGTIALTSSAMTGTFDGNNFAGGAVSPGDLLYGSSNGVIAERAIGTTGQVLQVVGGLPTWVATSSLGLGGNAGTVTSVDMSVPTGLTISGNPITSAGTLALAYAAGYEGLLTASSTNWNNFFDTPSSRITAGTGLSWTGNTINAEVQSSDLASFGLDNQIPFTNGTTDDYDYSANLTFDGSVLEMQGDILLSTSSSILIATTSNLFGGDLNITAGYSDAGTAYGGDLILGAGTCNGACDPGDVYISAGNLNNSVGDPGDVIVRSGTSPITFSVIDLNGLIISDLGVISSASWAGNVIGDAYLTKTGDWTGTIDGNNFSGGAIDTGDLLYGSGAGTIAERAIGTTGQVLQVVGGLPTWVATSSLGLGGNAGTVTSVDMSVPTGLTISGNPITSAGTLALAYAAGYEGLLTASSTNWNNFFDTPSTQISAGTAIDWSGNTLNVDVTGDWTGTLDGQEGSYYLDADNLANLSVADTGLSVSATGLTLTGDDIDLTAGYTIPLTASTSEWSAALASNHAAVTLAGENYLSLSGQEITANAIDLSGTNVTGTLAAARFPALTGDITTTAGSLTTAIAADSIIEPDLNADNGAIDGDFLQYDSTGTNFVWRDAGEVRSDLGLVIGTNVQAFDTDLTTWAGVSSSADGRSLVSAADYAAMRGLLNVDAAGTDNSTAVTLVGTPNYLTLSGQEITLNQLDLVDDLNTFTSADLADRLTNESGTGVVAFTTNPVFTTPNLGTPSTLVGTNITGTAASLTAGNVTTNANLTGDITSVGNAASIAAGAIIEPDLSTDNAANDGDFLQYDSTGTNFVWRSAAETLADIGAEATLTDEASLYATLSDVTQFWEAGDTLSSGSISSGFGNIDIGGSSFDAGAGDFSGTLTLSGSAANIALGSNWLSGDGDDEGVFVDGSGNIGIGTTTPLSKLSITNTGFSGAGTIGLDQYLTTANSVAAALQYGSRTYISNNSNTATTSLVGSAINIADSTTFGNTVRGLEVQADLGSNTQGENTALSGFARTFGVRGYTSADAGGSFEPAGGFFETGGTTQGNAIRGYSSSITSASLLSLFQDSSDFTGTGLEMNFGNTTGDFASTSSKYLDFQNAGTSIFTVSAFGTTTIGANDGTTVNMAGLQIGYGGLCVDNDGECTASTTGTISAVDYLTGNSDLAENYFSATNLAPGELVTLAGGLSVDRADADSELPILGVVSTKPGLTLGSDDTSLNAGETAYPIALSGRVPVRLSTENGPIEKGDRLMLSSLPGIAMKATGTGMTIGIALEDFDDSRMYSDTYLNQFADDMVDPIYEPVVNNTDPRINDGCYYGGGSAAGDAPCVPLVSTTTAGQIAEVNDRLETESVAAQIADLRRERSNRATLEDGATVRVGQVVMFVENQYKWVADDQLAMLGLLGSDELLEEAGEDETLFDRLVALANSFVDGVFSIFELRADRVEVADELCVDGVCIDADDLRRLLEQPADSGAGGTPPPTTPVPADDGEPADDGVTPTESEPVIDDIEEGTSATTTSTSTYIGTDDSGTVPDDSSVASSSDTGSETDSEPPSTDSEAAPPDDQTTTPETPQADTEPEPEEVIELEEEGEESSAEIEVSTDEQEAVNSEII